MTHKTQPEMVEWLKTQPLQQYSKSGYYSFRVTDVPTTVVTSIGTEKETQNVANAGDYILTGTQGEEYVISEETFNKRYELVSPTVAKASGKFYGTVYSGEFGDSFEFVAKWGENMLCKIGDMLGSPTADVSECYRIERKSFTETYA